MAKKMKELESKIELLEKENKRLKIHLSSISQDNNQFPETEGINSAVLNWIDLYRQIISSTPDSISLIDKNYKYIVANEAYAKRSDKEIVDIVGKTVSEVLGEDIFKNYFKEKLDRCLKGETIHYQEHFDFKGTGMRLWDVSYYPCKESNGRIEGIVVSARDLTVLKENEISLIESDNLFKSLFELSPDAIFLAERATGIIVNANPAACNLLEKNLEEIIGLHQKDLHPADQHNFASSLFSERPTAKRFEASHFILDVICNGGVRKTVEISSKSIQLAGRDYVIGNFRDISNRIKTEDALQEASRFSSQVIESASEGIVVHGMDQRVKVWNPYMERFTGIKAKDIIGKHPLELMPFLEQVGFIDRLKKALSGEVVISNDFMYDIPLTGKNGWASDLSSPIRNSKGEIIGAMIVVREITERRLALLALRKSEEKYRMLTENMKDVVWSLDSNTMSFSYLSPSIYGLRGFTPEEMVEQPIEALVIPGMRKYLLGLIHKRTRDFILGKINSENYFTDELEQTRKDGSTVWTEVISSLRFNEESKHIEIQGVTRDISDQKIIKRELSESEEKYRASFFTSPDAININSFDGVFVDTNDGFTDLTGYTREEVIGISSADINIWAIPEDREILIDGLLTHGVVENLETVFKCKDNSFKTGLISARIIKIKNKPHILSITRDISERKKIENALKTSKEKAEESDRLKSAFLANMSHEIRTPINAILGFSDLLSDPDLSFEDRVQFSQIIKSRSHDLMDLINDILDISKIEAGQLKISMIDGSINDLMDDIYEYYNNKKYTGFRPSVKFELINKIKNDNYMIEADFSRLKQILFNLLNNAFKFTEKGSIIFGCDLTKDGKLIFFVSDTGIGIPRGKTKLIFERFRQVEESSTRHYEGSGLGLSIAKGIIDLLGGKIWTESKEKVGSTFYFTIPFKKTVIIAESNDSKFFCDYSLSNKTILIVEDDIYNMMYLERLILSLKAHILEAKDGKSALETFRLNPDIDLVLMDIRLPDSNGYDLTKIMKSGGKHVAIIAQTGFAMEEDRIKSIAAGCDDYISKPINKELLFQKIKHLIG